MFQWTVHQEKGEGRPFHAAVAVRHEMYCFGGPRNENQIGVHVFNTVTLRWRELPPVTAGRGECTLEVPFGRREHTAVLIEGVVYMWGGLTNTGYCNVLHVFDVDTHRWSKPMIYGSVPGARGNHSACVLRKVMYIHGGFPSVYYNDAYRLDTTTMVWTLMKTIDNMKEGSFGHSATIIGTKMFVFGGRGRRMSKTGTKTGTINDNNIRVFDTETNVWLSTHGPRTCWDHSAFAYNGEVYIIDDWNLKSLGRFNPETFSWKRVEPKGKGLCPQRGTMRCGPNGRRCCMVGDRVILFGGSEETDDDLYILDLSPSMKTLCKLAVIQYGLEQSGLPHNIRWELAALTSKQ